MIAHRSRLTGWLVGACAISALLMTWAGRDAHTASAPPPAAEAAETDALSEMRAVLRIYLARYEAWEAASNWPVFPVGETLRPGMQSPRVGIAREILTRLGDLSAPPVGDALVFDQAMEVAVKHFQMRHGLTEDGVLGRQAQEALAVPLSKRITHLRKTLEAMENVQPPTGSRFVLVNVPSYHLTAMQGSRRVLTSRVIVGDTKNATPLFSSTITSVIFNPAWHVPARIAAEELVVKERDNPGYLDRAGFEMFDDTGEQVDTQSVDWQNVEDFSYRLRQSPGAGNALGKIKFNVVNPYDVYLHSTASPRLFAGSYRALSHGCVRVEKPRELAHFVMDGLEGWDVARINRAYDASAPRTVTLPQPLPVYLVYWPAWVDEGGQLHFSADVYRRF